MSSATPPRRELLATYLVPLGISMVVLASMQARFMGDTIDYVHSALGFDNQSWDFGHLFWLPLGWLAQQLGGSGNVVLYTYLVVNALSGLVSVVLLRATLGLAGIRPWTAAVVSIVFLFAQAMLNFTLSGCSYVPGLACTLLALYFALRDSRSLTGAWLHALGCGIAMAAGICFWFPYILVVPGVLLAPIVLQGPGRPRLLFVLRAGTALGIGLAASFGPAAWMMGVRDLAGLQAWVAKSSHGVQTGGAARMVFGLARSFVFMGDDGVLFKRYLLRDPYNPVSLGDLVGLSLWKLALFYLILAAVAVQLLRDPAGRRIVLLALLGGLPVMLFGVFWQGGDMERYLPLYPFFFLALAGACEAHQGWPVLRWLVAGFFILVVVINGYAHSRWQVQRYQASLTDRVRNLQPLLKPGSTLIVVRDRLKLLPRDFPLGPIFPDLQIHETATPGLTASDQWHRDFADVVLSTWANGGDVWLSKRLFEPRPRPDSTWVEGEDHRLRWADVRDFFTSLDIDEDTGDDGFVRLRDTPEQRDRLSGVRMKDEG